VEAGGESQQGELDSSHGLLRLGARPVGVAPQPQQAHQGPGRQHHPSQEIDCSEFGR